MSKQQSSEHLRKSSLMESFNGSNSCWLPCSNEAYGATATWIPAWGRQESFEFIFHLTQQYPFFKSHPVLDVWHIYNSGAERFDDIYNFRVTPGFTDLRKRMWSQLYFPEKDNQTRAQLFFQENKQGVLTIFFQLYNNTEKDLTWSFRSFCSVAGQREIAHWQEINNNGQSWQGEINDRSLNLQLKGWELEEVTLQNSNDWRIFPFNVEGSYFEPLPLHNERFRKRLCFAFSPLLIPAGGQLNVQLSIAFDKKCPEIDSEELFEEFLKEIPENILPFEHLYWEALHNQSYEKSLNNDNYTLQVIPARQWGRYFLWDCGFVAFAAAEKDLKWCEDILNEHPENIPEPANLYGAFLPIGILALWRAYLVSGNKKTLEKYYLKFKKLLQFLLEEANCPEAPGLLSPRLGAGSDDNPCRCYASKEVFTWSYAETLPRNPQGRNLDLISMEISAYGIRLLKSMRLLAYELQIQEEVEVFSERIALMQQSLEPFWSKKDEVYYFGLPETAEQLPIEWLGCHNILFADAIEVPERRERILKKLIDPAKYWTPYGLAAVALDSPFLRDGYPNGCCWGPSQFFYWLGFYSIGEEKAAVELIDNCLQNYRRIHKEDQMCWEAFRCKTGKGSGNSRFASFQSPFYSMWASREKYGTITVGFDAIYRHAKIEKDSLTMELETPFRNGKTCFSVVLSPNENYQLWVDNKLLQSKKSNSKGFLIFQIKLKEKNKTKLKIQKTEVL